MVIARSFRSVLQPFITSTMCSSFAWRSLATFRHQRTPPPATFEISSREAIEEETAPNYDANHFLPVNPGDLLHGRYEITAKLGWGVSSTVWLAKDILRWRWQSERYVVLKVNNSDFIDQTSAEYELKMTQRLVKGDPQHHGARFVRTILDNFTITGPDGMHVCLVYEPMRETLSFFQRRSKDMRLSLPLLKAFVRLLLMGLDYLHTECQMVHTDFGTAKLGTQIQIHPIQPDSYRAPEVLLGIEWSYSADIWNFGVMLWSLLENRDLFTPRTQPDGPYEPSVHLAQMIAFLGPPPQTLIMNRASSVRHRTWSPAFENPEGKLCERVEECFGGAFWDCRTGEFLRKELISRDSCLEDSVPSIQDEDEKKQFLEFVRGMLRWVPEERKTAKELLEGPWPAPPEGSIPSV